MAPKINGFNIGQDAQITITADNGQAFPAEQLGHLMEFEADWDDTEIKVVPITHGGKPLYDVIPHGITGRMSFTRMNGALSAVFADLMNDFYDNGLRHKFKISVRVLNRDGTVDTYLFDECSISKAKFGNFRADKEVDQSFSFRSQNMTTTARPAGIGLAGGI